MARVFYPGPPSTASCAGPLALEPHETVTPVPGDTGPISCSLLYFLDPLKVSLQTMEVAEELGALVGLATGRRVLVPNELPVTVKGSEKVQFIQMSRGLDRELIGPLPSDALAKVSSLLRQISVLSDADANTLSAALHLYYGASILVERDVRSAYIMLVSALEILSREYGSPPHAWDEWEEAQEWNTLFESLDLTPDQAGELRSRLLANRQLRLKRTFCEYAAGTLPETFWDETWEQWGYSFRPPTNDWDSAAQVARVQRSEFFSRDRAALRRALARSYDIRSAYVHRGETFGIAESARGGIAPVTGGEEIGYPFLRMIVRALLLAELANRSAAVP